MDDKVYTYQDGTKYKGQWKDNKRHGRGIWVRPDGTKYAGEWANDKPHGQGTLQFSDGRKYEGGWKEGKRHGQGIETSASGTINRGEWLEGKYVGEREAAAPSLVNTEKESKESLTLKQKTFMSKEYVEGTETNTIWQTWWMKSTAIIVVIGIVILIVFAAIKFIDQQKEYETIVQGPTVVDTGVEDVDTWANASNFLTSSEDGLWALHGNYLKVLSETAESEYHDLEEVNKKAQQLRDLSVPEVLQDLYIEYLVGLDLLEESIKAAQDGNFETANTLLNKGNEIATEALEKMSARATEGLINVLESRE